MPTALSPDQVAQFHQQGFLGPFDAMPISDMLGLRGAVTTLLQTSPDPFPEKGWHGRLIPRHHNRFLDSALAYRLSTLPEMVTKMTSITGDDLLLWRAHFFDKGPGAKEIPWHQDYNYWPLEPPVIISAWLAIDRVTRDNACLQVIPGSHRKLLPHIKATPDMAFLRWPIPNTLTKASPSISNSNRDNSFCLMSDSCITPRSIDQAYPGVVYRSA
ncbi:phytanoyl-CoA dioxygenase family protein [Pseudomonadales bacterium]|nr:phytanoyl-CoA dioxygenase family protein [Pseudomonadales bacterium]